MQVRSDSFADGARMDRRLALGKHADVGHFTFSANRSPHLAWSGAPAGTRSFAVICHDPDVPSVGDDVNQEGKTVPVDLPRVDFFHWVLVDVPASVVELAEGSHSEGVTAGGKAPGPAATGVQGVNDYTGWFAGNPEMAGDYGGYDGPGPPWNDERLHHYVFTVYALDVVTLGLSGSFTGGQALAALAGHVLAQASITGSYAINPSV